MEPCVEIVNNSFQCEYCEKKFTTKSNLKTHLRNTKKCINSRNSSLPASETIVFSILSPKKNDNIEHNQSSPSSPSPSPSSSTSPSSIPLLPLSQNLSSRSTSFEIDEIANWINTGFQGLSNTIREDQKTTELLIKQVDTIRIIHQADLVVIINPLLESINHIQNMLITLVHNQEKIQFDIQKTESILTFLNEARLQDKNSMAIIIQQNKEILNYISAQYNISQEQKYARNIDAIKQLDSTNKIISEQVKVLAEEAKIRATEAAMHIAETLSRTNDSRIDICANPKLNI
jgi:hypothetical protein